MALAFLRRHRRWFFVFLWVVILAFVILYIPNNATGGAGGEVVASVGGNPITTAAFQRQYQRQRRQFLAMNQGQVDEAMLERMGLREQVLSSLVRTKIEELEADRLGFRVDEESLRKAITEDPSLQIEGQFVGAARLTQWLQQQGMTARDFENEVRLSLKTQRLREAITDGATVSEADIAAEFHRRTDLINVQHAFLPLSQFTGAIQPTDAEIQARFDSNKDRYRLPERRIVSYVLVDPGELRSKVLPTGTEVEAYYRNNKDAEFTTGPQVCGRHILVKVKQSPTATEGHEDAAARTLADAAYARLKAGEPFEKVAKERSEDSSASNGGSLGCFGQGQMVPEFESVAFSLASGATSDVVKTPFGYHIIKVDAKVDGNVMPLEQARKRIEEQIQATRSREMASQKAEAVNKSLTSGQSLEQAATAQGLTVKKSEPLQLGKGAGVLSSPVLLSRVFEMKVKETEKDGFPAGAGAAFLRLDEIVAPKAADLAEVKDEVRKDLVNALAREKAREAARALAADAARSDLKKAAEKAKATFGESKSLVGRAQAFSQIPQGAQIEAAAFQIPEKTLSEPLDTPSGVAIVRILEKTVGDPAALAQQSESIKESLLNAKRDRIFTSYLQTLTERYPVTRNAEALGAVR